MRCPRCGREMTEAQLTLVGTVFECHACLGCNHLFVRLNTPRPAEREERSRDERLSLGIEAPAAEHCALTPEEEAAARRLLGGN